MNSSGIQLIAIDLDGTLLDTSRRVCPLAAQALCGMEARGVRVVIASARPPRSVRHIYQALALRTWQINYNGALIWDEPGKRAVRHTPLDGSLVRQIIDAARSRFNEVVVTCEILDRWHTDRIEQPHTTETGRLFQPDVIAPLNDFCNQPITKLMFLGDPAIIAPLHDMLQGWPDVSIVRGDPDLLQIIHGQASKATALEFVAEHYGVAMNNVMAIGDAANDIPMLQAAGVAVAMDNADARVKAAAHWVAPSNQDHGVHAALRHYGLCD